jgi:very-short-patch-repair endonuclease
MIGVMSATTEREIGVLAARQRGVVTRPQLLEVGVSASAITRRLRSGRLRQIHRGVYVVGPLELPGAREMAAVLACGHGALLSHVSAGSNWGLTRPVSASRPCDVGVFTARRIRRPGIRVRRMIRFDASDRAELRGIPVTAPGRTVVDLASVLTGRELEQAVARAEREGLVTLGDLSSLLVRHRGRPGIPLLRSLLETGQVPALTRSEAEERLLGLIRDARLPMPDTNVPIGPYEVDFLWAAEGIVVEVDGFRFHANRARFESDRRRDMELATRGINVVRLTWRQITNEPLATVVLIAQALATARTQQGLGAHLQRPAGPSVRRTLRNGPDRGRGR